MFPKNAIVLDRLHARRLSLLHSFLVIHPIMQPQVRNMQPDHIINNHRHGIRLAKKHPPGRSSFPLPSAPSAHQLKRRIARQPTCPLTYRFAQRRIHRHHAIPVPTQVAGNVKAGPLGLIADAHHGNRLRLVLNISSINFARSAISNFPTASNLVCHPERTGSQRTGLRPWGQEAKDPLCLSVPYSLFPDPCSLPHTSRSSPLSDAGAVPLRFINKNPRKNGSRYPSSTLSTSPTSTFVRWSLAIR